MGFELHSDGTLPLESGGMSFSDCWTGAAAQLCCKEGSLAKQIVHSQHTSQQHD